MIVFVLDLEAIGFETAVGAGVLLVACRLLVLVLVAGRLLEKRTFRRCLPVAAMTGMGSGQYI